MNCSAPFGSIAIVASASATAFVLEHGYCRSVYVTDPNGMIVELTHDAPNVEQINADRLADAHAELKRWLGGDHDDYRAEIQKSSACVGTTTERDSLGRYGVGGRIGELTEFATQSQLAIAIGGMSATW
jgi:hypothetical protein